MNPGVRLRMGNQQSQFWPILVHFVHYYSAFGVPKRFPRLAILGVCLHVHHRHSQYCLILTRFMDYYSPFWGPKAIFIVVKPQGALVCRSSTLAVLADSGPFHGLLLMLLGYRSDFNGC